jgi:hypothetical protein
MEFGDEEGQPDEAADLTALTGADAESLRDILSDSTDLADAANDAIDWFIADDESADEEDDIAVVFSYNGEEYLAIRDFTGDENDPAVETIVRITGFVGTIDSGDFTTDGLPIPR